MAERAVRPTVLEPLWHVAGFALGAATALLGKEAAMACTVAVEDVIGAHYAEQAAQLGDDEAALRDTVAAYGRDERAHRDEALAAGAERAPAYPLLSETIKGATKLAIWLSKRIYLHGHRPPLLPPHSHPLPKHHPPASALLVGGSVKT